jgi:hypothetical protein
MEQDMSRRSSVGLYSKTALLVIGMVGIALIVSIGLPPSSPESTPALLWILQQLHLTGIPTQTTTPTTAENNTGTMIVSACYPRYMENLVPVLVSVSGPENVSGMTTTWMPYNPGGPNAALGLPAMWPGWNVLTFNLIPGAYTVSGTYEGIFRSENVVISQGEITLVILIFEGTSTTTVTTTTTTTASNEAENRVGGWVLSVRVTPTCITANNNITVEETLKYVGSENCVAYFSANDPEITVKSTNGATYYDSYSGHVQLPLETAENITPQFSCTYQGVTPPLPPGAYNVLVDMHWPAIILVTLPIEVEP